MKDTEQLQKKFFEDICEGKYIKQSLWYRPHLIWQWILDNYLSQTEPSEQKQEWISVKDRLPEYNTEILISYYPKHPTMDGRQKIGINKRLEIVNSSMYSMVNDDGFPKYIGAITHWMPLPERPKTNQP